MSVWTSYTIIFMYWKEMMFKKRQTFLTNCPYCNSGLRVKANHRLKFKTYYFENLLNKEEIYKYRHIPIWKCSCCKQRFAVDMINQKSYTLEKIPEMGLPVVEVTREEFLMED